MSFFKTVQTLFPRAKAFSMIQESKLKSFIKGLCHLPDNVKTEMEKVFFDIFPDSTRALEEWENQFAVLFANEQYGTNRRGILKALWQVSSGGQTAYYLEQLLQKVDKGLFVFENIPVKNPRDANSVFSCMCRQKSSVCGNRKMICGYKVGDAGFQASVLMNNGETPYDIPDIEDWWANCFFIAASVVRNSRNEIIYCQKLTMDSKWRPYIEYLILKVKPVQTAAVIFINWVDGYDETNEAQRNRRI